MRACTQSIHTLAQISKSPEPDVGEQENFVGSDRRFHVPNRRLGATRRRSHQPTAVIGHPILNDLAMMTVLQWNVRPSPCRSSLIYYRLGSSGLVIKSADETVRPMHKQGSMVEKQICRNRRSHQQRDRGHRSASNIR